MVQYLGVLWKTWGNRLLDIENDRYLAIVGSCSSVLNGLGRIFWGRFFDRNGSFRFTMTLVQTIWTLTLGTLIFCKV